MKAVIFDIDNTIYSYDEAHAVAWQALCAYAETHLDMDAEAFAKAHKAAAATVKQRLGAECAALHNRQLRYQVLLEAHHKPLHHAIAMNELYWDVLIREAKPAPGILECLSALKQAGYRLGIGTNMTIDYQLKKLVALQMLHIFDFIVSSEEVNVEKPNEKLFRCCAQKAGLEPKECVFVGDSLVNDYYGATDAGMMAVWYCPDARMGAQYPQIRRIAHYDQLREMLIGG